MEQRILRRTAGPLALLAAALSLSACGTAPAPDMASVSGTAIYRERIALPPAAVFEARIEDVSRADAAATVIASSRLEPAGNPPFRFTIHYAPTSIRPQGRYVIRTRVVLGEELMFTSDTATPLPPAGADLPGEILMVRAQPAVAPAAPAATARPGELRGMYSYMADAGLFTDCASGERLPVVQEGDNAALEAAYSAARVGPAEPLLATVVGRIETRAPMEGPPRPMLVVEQFISVAPGQCGHRSTATLENTYWKLVQVGGQPVTLAENQREPYFVLHSADHRVAGYAGCNRMTGGYALDGGRLSFTQMAGTMMACAQGMDVEQAFHQALTRVAGWRIDGEALELTDAAGGTLAMFESRYLR